MRGGDGAAQEHGQGGVGGVGIGRVGRIQHGEVELEVLEDHGRPSGRHRPSVAIPKSDLHRLELHRVPGRSVRHADEAESLLRSQRLDRGAIGLEVERAGAEALLAHAQLVRIPIRAPARREHPVDRDEGVVDVVHNVAASVGGSGHHAGHWSRDDVGDELEGAVEAVHDAIELDAHLPRQRPAGVVVRRGRRRARVGEVVRMLLLFEHVEHVRTKRLSALHHVGSLRVPGAGDREVRARSVDVHTTVEQRVDEFRRGQEVALVRRNDEAARVAIRRIAQDALTVLSSAAGHRVGGRVDLERHRGPRVGVATRDRVGAHLPDVEQQVV